MSGHKREDPRHKQDKPPFPEQKQRPTGSEQEMHPKPDFGQDSYRGSGRLAGKTALVTGGDSGIGRAVCVAFAREGADVVIGYREHRADAQETQGWVEQAGRRGVAIAEDIASDAGCKTLIDGAAKATKGAIVTFTKGLAQELIARGIRVNAVAPGPVWTPLVVQSFDAEKNAHFGEDSPMGRPAQPAELAPAFVFLASDEASYVNGEVLGVTGGKPVS